MGHGGAAFPVLALYAAISWELVLDGTFAGGIKRPCRRSWEMKISAATLHMRSLDLSHGLDSS